jgi:hypothetical protein
MEDVVYFHKKLLNSLNVPISRLDPQGGGIMGIGRVSEVTRDEIKFSKFVARLRNKFSRIFDDALRIQLSLKGICTIEEWEEFKEAISYDFKKDNSFTEMRDAEIMRERILTATQIDPYIGRYYSSAWVKKNVLRMTQEEIDEMQKEIEAEGELAGPVLGQQGQEQGGQPQEPIDNTVENGDAESPTPQLDDAVNKFNFNKTK